MIAGSVELAEVCCRASPMISLRTLDGLHLATARLLKCKAIATTDHRIRTAAEAIGLDAL
ncbi:MAG: PIN domain-containing protein [Verrucomicrobia bacterium]|nr:PIN domain-containing protein [Verrucomicrobiota bacterium]